MSTEDCMMIVTGTIGAGAFSFFFNINKKYIIYSLTGGLIASCTMAFFSQIGASGFVSNLFVAIFCSIYAEKLARIFKAPSLVFLLPSVIPALPGSGLYYTMSAVIHSDPSKFELYGFETLQMVLGIAFGLILSTLFIYRHDFGGRGKIHK